MSLDMNGFLAKVKRAAAETVAAGKPFAFCLGRVAGTEPLRVQVDQKLTLSAPQLILTNAVRDYIVRVEITSEGEKELFVHMALKEGEQVLLLRCDGGQKYIILDRLEAPQ